MRTHVKVRGLLLLLFPALLLTASTLLAQSPESGQPYRGASSLSTTDASTFNLLDSFYIGAGGIWFIVLISIYFLVKKEQKPAH